MTDCQRWREGTLTWRRPADGGFVASRYEVTSIPVAMGEAFVRQHHYSGSAPASRFAFGLWGPSGLEGVAVLGVPMSSKVLTKVFPDLAPYTASIELSRFVLLDEVPANGESFTLSRVHTLAARAGIRGMVAFSDPVPRSRLVSGRLVQVKPGHCGLIYQATGARALGRSTPRTLIQVNGRVLSARTLQKIRAGEPGAAAAEAMLCDMGATPRTGAEDRAQWLAQALADVGASRTRHPGNYRYAWALGTPSQKRRARIGLADTAYPKPGR